MKYYESHYEEYITSIEKYNLHPDDLLEWMETEEQIKYPHYRERTLK